MIWLICAVSSEFKFCFNVLLLKICLSMYYKCVPLAHCKQPSHTIAALRGPSRTASLCSVLFRVYSSYLPESQLQCHQQFIFYAKASCTFSSLAAFQSRVLPASSVYMATTVTTRVGVIYYLCHQLNA